MSLHLASRRLALSARSASITSAPSTLVPSTPCSQRRSKWSVNIFKGWGKSGSKDASASKSQDPTSAELDDPKKRAAFLERNMHGSVSDNIFQDEIDAARPPPTAEESVSQHPEQKTRENMAMVTDPDPRSRIRWQRRKVIQMVRSNGNISKEERIKMTERQLLHKSHFMPTSVKKLVMLSRQIAGKNVDDAITQMTWSKKKMAAEIKYYLEEARDLAIAQRGMGLGKVNGETLGKARKIQTKDGKWIEVTDPTRMYIAQSWVGRGPWRGKEIDYKGRGRMGVIQHPSTSFTILLKEEKTRIREYEEREAKKTAKGPWVHLPNRRVTGQRPYYSW
ncbi:39S ribosomal protein L22, mitochondrial [Conoideocrella luteorostrata]|uniref:39S ribosomal protein L22, mitochondrial n=1 Tax=Conoideocrella luteorostrata TaxID=1105319 RepID=A0AAJ0FYE2_9HYPO|nr:39S ribosomal protein L22, mitochondrial [Conoideocrella luteorostrata]